MPAPNSHPHDRPGTEPLTARSPLRLRLVMAVVAAVLFGLGALALFTDAATTSDDRAARVAGGAIAALVAVIAVIDAVVVSRRLRRHDTG